MVLAFGSSADAQYGLPGGIAPYTFNAPAAGAEVTTGAAESSTSCYWQAKGRAGGQYQCPAVPPAAPNKPGEGAKK